MNHIIDRQTAAYFQWGQACDGWVLVDTDGLSVKQEMMPSGTKETLHFHNRAQQFFFVTAGTAAFYVDGERKTVSEQQELLIPAESKH